jgi:predicted NAD/FAD-dependent oxidoreductase
MEMPTIRSIDVLIVGGGPSGISAACCLQKEKSLHLTILEKGSNVGADGPFNVNNELNIRLGPQMVSFNVSESSVASWLSQLSTIDPPLLQYCDDLELSETLERPHGWSRVTGQWKQYRLLGDMPRFLRGMVNLALTDERPAITLKCDASVISLNTTPSIDNEDKKWLVRTDDGAEYTCDALILALPPGEIHKLIAPIHRDIVPQYLLDAVKKSEALYTTKHTCLLSVSKTSELGMYLLKKFSEASMEKSIPSGAFTREIDVSAVGTRTLTLICLVQADDHSPHTTSEEMVNFVIHSNSASSIDRSTLLMWMSSWLGIETLKDSSTLVGLDGDGLENSSAVSVSHYAEFRQAGFTFVPLSPQPERGCLATGGRPPIPTQTQTQTQSFPQMQTVTQRQGPPLVLCGDWAVGSGSVSGALLSGKKAAEVLVKLLKTEAGAVS